MSHSFLEHSFPAGMKAQRAKTCGRSRRHRRPAPGCREPSRGKRPRHTRCVSRVPSAVKVLNRPAVVVSGLQNHLELSAF